MKGTFFGAGRTWRRWRLCGGGGQDHAVVDGVRSRRFAGGYSGGGRCDGWRENNIY